ILIPELFAQLRITLGHGGLTQLTRHDVVIAPIGNVGRGSAAATTAGHRAARAAGTARRPLTLDLPLPVAGALRIAACAAFTGPDTAGAFKAAQRAAITARAGPRATVARATATAAAAPTG